MRLYIFGIILLAVSLPLSLSGLTIAQICLLLVWIFGGPFSGKGVVEYLYNCRHNVVFRFKMFLHDKTAVILVSLYLLHVIGLIWTSDFQHAFNDLRIKLSLIVFPIIFSSMPRLSRKQTHLVLWLFIAAVFVGTLFSFSKFIRRDFLDVRELSIFVAHVRFCLCIVFSIFILAYFFVKAKNIIKVGMVMLILWFVWQIVIFESFVGVVILIILPILIIGYFAINKLPIRLTIVVGAAMAVFIMFGVWKFFDWKRDFFTPEVTDFSTLDKTTALGNEYIHDTINFGIENGKYIGLYYSPEEFEQTWKERSDLVLDSENLSILMRYLTSKEYRKDAEGIGKLTEEDVNYIENGIANVLYITNPGVKTRFSKIFLAYTRFEKGNPNGSSVFQRIEYTKASLQLIKRHPLLGVGTGDVPNAFSCYYEETHSPLQKRHRNVSHNQYLHITVALGVVGFVWFMITMLYPYFCNKKNRNYLYSTFLAIIMLSMLSDDTIETSVGVTLYAFFNAFLLFASYENTDAADNCS